MESNILMEERVPNAGLHFYLTFKLILKKFESTGSYELYLCLSLSLSLYFSVGQNFAFIYS